MHGQRQDAAVETVPFQSDGDWGSNQRISGTVELDAQGQMLIEGRRASYASLFSRDARALGRPEELLRLARRHGLVRDCVLRFDASGVAQQQRIALQALRDAQGRLVGFREFRLRQESGA